MFLHIISFLKQSFLSFYFSVFFFLSLYKYVSIYIYTYLVAVSVLFQGVMILEDQLKGSRIPKARFGSSIENVGDLNMDGYDGKIWNLLLIIFKKI